MGYSWSTTVTAGSTKITNAPIQEVVSKINSLRSALIYQDGCASFSCSSLVTSATINTLTPSQYSKVTSTQLSALRTAIDSIDNNKFDCATACWTVKYWYKGSYKSSYDDGEDITVYRSQYNTHHDVYCSSKTCSRDKVTVHGTYNTTY